MTALPRRRPRPELATVTDITSVMSATITETKILPVDHDETNFPIWVFYLVAFLLAFVVGMIVTGAAMQLGLIR